MNEQGEGRFLPEQREIALDRRERWRQYEYLKSMLPIDLSSKEYQEACWRIARELGI